jgi:hypothetical protein
MFKSKTAIDLSMRDFVCENTDDKPFIDAILYDFNKDPLVVFRIINTQHCSDHFCTYIRDKHISIINDELCNEFVSNKINSCIGVRFIKCKKRFIITYNDKIIAKINGDILNKKTELKANNLYTWKMKPEENYAKLYNLSNTKWDIESYIESHIDSPGGIDKSLSEIFDRIL